MRAVLQTKIQLWNIDVFAELAVWEPRPELQRLCVTAVDSGRLDGPLVASQLPGLSERAYINLMRSLAYLQLVDGEGRLTAFGRRCAETGEAPAWEQGVYHLLVAVNPLCGGVILAFDRADSDGQDRDFSNLEGIPAWLQPSREHVHTSVFDRTRFSLAAFPSPRNEAPKCRGRALPDASLTWTVDLTNGDTRWFIEGAIGPRDKFRTTDVSLTLPNIAAFFGLWEPRWDPRRGFAAIAYDHKADADGSEDFRRTWKYSDVEVRSDLHFASIIVDNIPVGPASDADAHTWATAIAVGLVSAGDGYVTPNAWSRLWQDVTQAAPLSGRAGQAPDPTTVRQIGARPLALRTYWLLAAAADIGTEEV
jgi:hypothetical protein